MLEAHTRFLVQNMLSIISKPNSPSAPCLLKSWSEGKNCFCLHFSALNKDIPEPRIQKKSERGLEWNGVSGFVFHAWVELTAWNTNPLLISDNCTAIPECLEGTQKSLHVTFKAPRMLVCVCSVGKDRWYSQLLLDPLCSRILCRKLKCCDLRVIT